MVLNMVLSFSKIGRIPFLNDSEHVLYFHNPKCSCRQVDNVFVAYHMCTHRGSLVPQLPSPGNERDYEKGLLVGGTEQC